MPFGHALQDLQVLDLVEAPLLRTVVEIYIKKERTAEGGRGKT
jgi:hypothetical protein